MFLIEKNVELTPFLLGKILNKFNTLERPKLQRLWDYYQGKQDILMKTATSAGKPCNKIVVNYCKPIVNNYVGYIAGQPIKYNGEQLEQILDVLNYNDVASEDTEYLRQALIFGKAYEINYIDEDVKQRFKVLDARECVPIYSNTLNNDLLYVVRFYREDLMEDQNENYIVEVYGSNTIKKYRSNSGFSSFSLIEEVKHFYNQCPITVFSLNSDEESIFKQIMSLQDSYNQLISDEVDDVDAFADSYLILKGVTADEEDLDAMKQQRVLMIDNESDASYLTKSISDTQVQTTLKTVNDHIHTISSSPDFNSETFQAATGIALRLKLIGLENAASGIETQMKKALQRRIELISSIVKLTGGEDIWRDVEIVFTRNLPVETENIVNMVNSLRGLVSTETLLGQIPFIEDPEEEAAKVKEESVANMELYSFGDDDSIDIKKGFNGKLIDE